MPSSEFESYQLPRKFHTIRVINKGSVLDRGYISRVVYIYRIRYFPLAINNSALRRARLIIEIRVDEILAEQGRTFYWLAKQTGISHTTLWRLKKGKAFGMNLDTLEKMCRVLECQPGDILTLPNQKKNGITSKSMNKTR